MASRPEYPFTADAKWGGPLIVAALVSALEAARTQSDAAMLGWGVASVCALTAATWWITRHERLSRLMAKNPAFEGLAVIDEVAKAGRRRCTVMLRNGRGWRWTIDSDASPVCDARVELRVRVWARGPDVVARTSDRTLWPVGVVRRVRDDSDGPQDAHPPGIG